MKANKNLMTISSYLDLPIQERASLVIAISKPTNFFLTWFNNLPFAESKSQCFYKLNELHNEIYKEDMYSSYKTFQTCYSRFLKSRRKRNG